MGVWEGREADRGTLAAARTNLMETRGGPRRGRANELGPGGRGRAGFCRSGSERYNDDADLPGGVGPAVPGPRVTVEKGSRAMRLPSSRRRFLGQGVGMLGALALA